MKHGKWRWWACGLAAVACAAVAQPREPVLQGAQVTEDALIDALAIDGPAPAVAGARRGFRPAVQAPKEQAGHAAGPGRASLLITFQTDSAVLLPESRNAVDVVARALQSDKLAGYSFRVEGHADPRGSTEHNLKLSQQRAAAVVEYLVSHHGILAERLTAQGKGSAELMDKAHPTAPENRRVSIVTQR
jgi:outer membrane protein OmpA-like peptidoglycan-associated protein